MRTKKMSFLFSITIFFLMFAQLDCRAEEKKEDAALKTSEITDEQFNADIERHIVEFSALNELLEKQNKTMIDKINELTAITQDKTDFKKELEKSKNENTELSKRIKELETELGRINQEKAGYKPAPRRDLREKITDLTRKLSEANKNIKSLRDELRGAHYNLGVIFQDAHQYDNAIKEYEKVLELNPNDADASYNMALIYDTVKNNREKANYYYSEYLALNPEAQDAAKIKKRITGLDLENRVWGDPDIKGIGQKEKLGRW